jgi:dihydroorotase
LRARQGLWGALKQGNVQVVVSDHAPHPLSEKQLDYPASPPGMPGVETGFPLLLASCFRGEIPLSRVVELYCSNPSRVFGLGNRGRLEEGAVADIVVVKPGESRKITASGLHSKCGWTPYEGFEGCFPINVLHHGELAVEDGEVVAEAGSGEWLPGNGYTRRRLPVRDLK